MLGNLCVEMFQNKFFSMVSCSAIKVIIEEPTCSGSCESIQVLKNFNQFSSQFSLYQTDEIKVLDSLVVFRFIFYFYYYYYYYYKKNAVVSDFSNLLLFSVPFLFYQCLVLNVGARISLHNRAVDELWDLYSGRISSLFLYIKLWAMNLSTRPVLRFE